MGLRSFSRSFIISPAPADSPAMAAGWPLQIISDQLSVRTYSGNASFSPTAVPVGPGPTLPPVAGLPTPSNVLVRLYPPCLVDCPGADNVWDSLLWKQTDAQKEDLVKQFSQRSGLIVPFTIQCLEGNGWDLERAWANFVELKVRSFCSLSLLTARI